MERQQGEWWVGSNGNLFCDLNGFRYCIAKTPVRRITTRKGELTTSYSVARNGEVIARAPSLADAKLYVKREG